MGLVGADIAPVRGELVRSRICGGWVKGGSGMTVAGGSDDLRGGAKACWVYGVHGGLEGWVLRWWGCLLLQWGR